MENQDSSLRDRLISQLPQPANLESYRRDVAQMVVRNDKRIRRERLVATVFCLFCICLTILYVWFDPKSSPALRGPALACIIFVWGMAELLKHYINACRIDLLKEIKQVQVQVLELHAAIDKRVAQ